MARFYLPPDEWGKDHPVLQGEEARHATKVLRLKEGKPCIVFNGLGTSANAHIERILSPNEVSLVIGQTHSKTHNISELTLLQSIPKGGNMDLIIQKSVELGVSAIIPLITERTIVRITGEEADKKQSKWQRAALEACKQCGQNVIPIIGKPITFSQWLADYVPNDLAIIASLTDGALPIRDILEKARAGKQKKASILIGPEGDFTKEETSLAINAGFIPVSLGPIVMRVETATFFSLSVLRYTLD